MREYTLVPTRSAASSVTTDPLDLLDMEFYGFQVVFSGSDVVGTTKLQGSLNNVNYEDITDSLNAVTTSTGILYSVSQASYRYVRLVWAYTSGTGNITVLALTKETLVKIDPVV